jgi:membrane-bound metal-dependent hydrolase YbcI (DUF457 family)
LTSKTHATLGLLVAIAMLRVTPFDPYIIISGACIGSLLPDLDTKKSDPSQIFPFVSWIVDKFTKHRGWTHATFPFVLIILYLYYKYLPFLALGVGALSHTLIDELTMVIRVRCQSRGEWIIYKGLWIAITVLLVSFWVDFGIRL